MGSILTQQQQSLSESLQQQYFFQSSQFILHKATHRPCTLHRISTFSKQESTAVERNLQLYSQSKCQSISKIREHFVLDDSGYCSDQQKFYLIFDGHHSPNVKEQYFSRRYASQSFSPEEIQSILSCMLCGLQTYSQKFNRKQSRISLESVCIDRSNSNSLWVKDPWLVEKQNDSSQLPINFLASYPSPQKIQASTLANFDYDEFKSDLFSIGVFGLQFLSMNFRDDLYVHKKYVDRMRVNESLNMIKDARLRGGINILLSEDPQERFKIYRYWDISDFKVYRIRRFQFQNSQHPHVQPENQQLPLPVPPPQIYQPPVPIQHQPYPLGQVSNVSSHVTQGELHQKDYQNPKIITHNQINNPSHINHFQYLNKPSPFEKVDKLSTFTIPKQQDHRFISGPPVQQIQIKGHPLGQQEHEKFESGFSTQRSNQLTNYTQPNTPRQQFTQYPKYLPHTQDQRQHSPQPQLTSQFAKTLSVKKQIPQNPTVQTGFKKKMNITFQNIQTNNQNNYSNGQRPIQINGNNIQSNSPRKNQYWERNRQTQSQNNQKQQAQVFKSFQTPRFNLQSSLVNQNHNQQNPVSSFSSQFQEIKPNIPSPTQSISSSPILSKSVLSTDPISASYTHYQQGKLSSEATQTGIFPEKERVTVENAGRKTYEEFTHDKTSSFQTDKPSFTRLPEIPALSPQLFQEKQSFPPRPSLPISSPSPLSQAPFSSSPTRPQSSPSKPQQSPTSPSTIPLNPSTVPLTPPPPVRNPNKYNSTIIEVNEETPNESSDSQKDQTAQIQYVVQEYQTGSRYEGYKKNKVRHGKGKFFYQDGGYYDGDWKNNQMHGWGKLYYQGGQLAYEGNWAHDEFHGYGKVYNDNPVAMTSGFDYTNFDLLQDYWQFYQGMLAKDTKQGRGRIQLTNKEVFQGDFHSDRIQGFGKFLRKDGTVVQGIWRDSRLIKVLNSNDIYK